MAVFQMSAALYASTLPHGTSICSPSKGIGVSKGKPVNSGGVSAKESIFLKREQFIKTLPPIVFTERPIVMVSKEEQPAKAPLPILVTPSGIVIESREEQPPKATLSILVTELGITVLLQPTIRVFVAISIIALQLSRLS